MENMHIYTCSTCSKIHVEIGNTIIHFATPEKLKTYLVYLESIDVKYYSEINRKRGLSKEIFLQITNESSLAFTVSEFEHFKQVIFDYLTGTEAFIKTAVFQSAFLN